MLEAFVGPARFGKECNHKDGDKLNNRLSNLEWVTRQENHQHRTRVLGKGRGSTNGRAKLNDDAVRTIRQRLTEGQAVKRIARDFGVSPGAVYFIRTGQHWAHVV